MDAIIVAAIIGIAFLIFLGKSIYERVTSERTLRYKLKMAYGNVPETDYSLGRYDNIRHYFDHKEHRMPVIDDITWNDLDMDTIYMILNNTCTSVGEEYLYDMLRSPIYESSKLIERDKLAAYFDENEKERLDLQVKLRRLGKLKFTGVSENLDFIFNFRSISTTFSIVSAAAAIVSIMGLFIQPMLFLFVFFGVMAVNMGTYYSRLKKIKAGITVTSYILKMLECSKQIIGLNNPEFKAYTDRLKEATKRLDSVRKQARWFSGSNDMDGNIFTIIYDYIKSLFHIDLIIFNSAVYKIQREKDQIYAIVDNLGELDSLIAVASYRAHVKAYCRPQLSHAKDVSLKADDVRHPLITEPVLNSINESRSVLLTGSNASGKSTFLKTIAINALLAQTIYTCLASEYKANYFRILTSMALRDDIMSSESYFIVEIKSLKRIVDGADHDIPMLCFVDEVLRGTNTVERIAASAQILSYLSRKRMLCFAATHDIELTHILEKDFSNYHFQEEIKDNDILFDYKLYQGRATSRNAIKLLGVIGFSNHLIDLAENSAARFESQGSWSL